MLPKLRQRRSVCRPTPVWALLTALAIWAGSQVTGAEPFPPANNQGNWLEPPTEMQRLPPTHVSPDDAPANLHLMAPAPVSPASAHHAESSSPTISDPGPWLVGYDQGFVIASNQGLADDPDAVDFMLRINGWFHLRHTLFESRGPNPDQNTISFERLRLIFAGHAFAPEFAYFVQLDGNTDRATNTVMLDYFVTYDVGHDLWELEAERLGIKLGQWKVPFSRSREESGRRLQFTERAAANLLFDLDRSLGVGLTSQIDSFLAVKPVQLETAVFNGFQTGGLSTSRDAGLDRNLGWSIRGHVDPFGDFGNDGEPDLSWHEDPALRVGGGLAVVHIEADGMAEFDRLRVVDSGATLSSLLPGGVSAYNVWLYTIDAHYKYRGLAFIAEYYWRHLTQFNGPGVPNLLDDGFVLQTGYFVVPKQLELLARWSRITGDSGTLGATTQSSDEFGAGVVWYIRGHNAKLTFDASRFNGSPVSSDRLELQAGDAGWLFRTQCQIAF